MTKDEKYMDFCIAGGKIFSTCVKRNYMAIILDAKGRVASTGYNGSPPGVGHCVDGYCPRVHEGTTQNFDNCIAVHAELNAIMFSDPDRRHTLYVNGIPCYGCAKDIVGSGLERVVYLPEYDRTNEGVMFLLTSGLEAVPIGG